MLLRWKTVADCRSEIEVEEAKQIASGARGGAKQKAGVECGRGRAKRRRASGSDYMVVGRGHYRLPAVWTIQYLNLCICRMESSWFWYRVSFVYNLGVGALRPTQVFVLHVVSLNPSVFRHLIHLVSQ